MVESDLLEETATFASLDLEPRLQRALSDLKYEHPTLIQSTAIPLALKGKDILARARTGSGKTAAYCLPVIQKILSLKEADASPAVRGLILVPTKELSEQVFKEMIKFTAFCSKEIKVVNLSNGDASLANQRPLLAEKPDVIISTPSKILAHLNASHVDLSESLDSLVIDEADLILSYGYDEDMKAILALLPPIYQSYLMSATMSPDVDELKQLVLRNPAVLKLEEANDPHLLTQYVVRCTEQDKYLLTFFILKLKVHPFGSGKCILFVNSIDRCYRLKLFLEQFGVKCCTLNSELPLKSRFHIVQEFNRGVYDFIIATDESGDLKFKEVDSDEEDEEDVSKDGTQGTEESKAETSDEPTKKRQKKTKKKSKDLEYGVSRGIDFKNVQAVINFDVPRTSRSYMHRVGRTARGVGNKGFALTFLEEDAETAAPVGKGTTSDKRVITQGSVFKRIEKRQTQMGRDISDFKFDMTQVEGFRYRVEDGLRAVTGTSVREARLKDLKNEVINSEKLKSHFEENPKDLHALRHDKPLHPSRVQPHMKHVPDYLLPKRSSNGSKEGYVGYVPFKSSKSHHNKKRGGPKSAAQKRRADPLKSFTRAAGR